MQLTTLIRRQLVVFVLVAVGALAFTANQYAKVPERLGLGVDQVKVQFDDASGLYTSAIVTYRGVKVGTVSDLDLGPDHATATLTLDSGADVPRSAIAEIHSTSAIGEQYVDLVPKDGKSPFLRDGDTIPASRSRSMPQISPVLDKLNGLLAAVPKDATSRVLTNVNDGLGGTGNDIGQLLDSSTDLVQEARDQVDATRSLIQTLEPVLDTQQAVSQDTLGYAKALAGLTHELAGDDQDIQALLKSAPDALAKTSSLASDLQGSLPVLLANLTTNAEVANTYLPNIQQSLSTYPALMARVQYLLSQRELTDEARLDLRAGFNDPASCIKGYLPPSARRSPTASTTRDIDGSYCQVAKSSPEGVRGARNYPCPNNDLREATPTKCGLEFESRTATTSRAATFDAASGRFYAPDGTFLNTTVSPKGVAGWQTLLLGPLGLN